MIDQITSSTFPAVRLLFPRLMTLQAQAMLLAIGLQESRFVHRRQNYGPALGFWQFEKNGVRAVCRHLASADYARHALKALRYEDLIGKTTEIHYALHDNDTLACAFARLLLYTLPTSLPGPTETQRAWDQYLAAWQPGKPHPETWGAFYAEAWQRVSLTEDL